MKITYDKKVDAVYIKLNEHKPYDKTKKITEDVLVDYSKDGQVVGVEVLDASKNIHLPANKSSIPVETHS